MSQIEKKNKGNPQSSNKYNFIKTKDPVQLIDIQLNVQKENDVQSDNISSDSVSIVSREQNLKPPVFQKHHYSYIMLLVSCFLWVTGFIYANQNNMSPFETTISRYTFMFFVTYIHCRYNGSPLVFFNRPHEKVLWFRSVVIALHSFVVAIMQFYLPLGTFHTLVICGQVFIFLANYLLRDVKISYKQAIAVGVSFIGLALIINGRLIYEMFFSTQSQFQTQFHNYHSTDTSTQIKMACLYVLWNAVWAVSVVLTKIPQYSASEILFSQSFVSIIFAAIGYIFFNVQQRVSLQTYIPSLLSGVVIMVANYFFAYGIIWSSNTGISTMMLMSSAVFGYFISIFRYNEKVNGISLIGTVILVISAGYVVFQQQRVNK